MHSRSRRVAIVAAMAMLLPGAGPQAIGTPAAAPPGVVGPQDAINAPAEAGLQALHRGDYRLALAEFKRAADAQPGAPGPLFYLVFARWWQMLFAGEAPRRDDASWTAFSEAYDQTVQAADDRLASEPGDAGALAALGGAQVLRAHLEATLGSYFRAGAEARRGKKALSQALETAPGLESALFPLGALNYYADRVPLIVKTIRPLLFLPGGDAAEGLRQIRAVATGTGPLHTDGRLLLGMVCADRYQRAYRDALAQLRTADRETGGSPLVGAAIGDLLERIGEVDEAAVAYAEAADRATGNATEQAHQRRWLRLGQAEALVAGWRLVEGQRALLAARAEIAPMSDAMRRLDARIDAELQAKLEAVPFYGGDPPGDPLAAARALVDAHPGAGIPLLAYGRLLYLAGRDAEAIGPLASAAEASHDGPVWLAGWAELYSGFAADRLGRHKEARGHFEEAASLRRFRSSDRGRLELGERGDDAALCQP